MNKRMKQIHYHQLSAALCDSKQQETFIHTPHAQPLEWYKSLLKQNIPLFAEEKLSPQNEWYLTVICQYFQVHDNKPNHIHSLTHDTRLIISIAISLLNSMSIPSIL